MVEIKRTGTPLIFDVPVPAPASPEEPVKDLPVEGSSPKELPVNDAITALEDIIRKDWAHMDEDWQKKAKVKLQAIQIALATATKVDATSVQKQRADLADEMFADLLRMKARLDGEHALVIDGAESSE